MGRKHVTPISAALWLIRPVQLVFELRAREQSKMLIKETMNVTVPSTSIKLTTGHNSCIP